MNMRKFNVKVNGREYAVEVEEVKEAAPAPVAAPPAQVKAAPAPVQTIAGTKVCAPMPGTVLDIKVEVGSLVSKGQVLMILEAMKMENDIVSPCNGKIAKIFVAKDSAVKASEELLIVV